MLPGLLGGQGHNSNAKYIDIRLQDDYIVFRGGEHEAPSAHLKGSLVLCLSEPITVKHVRLKLTGMSRISWNLPPGTVGASRRGLRERNFFEKQWIFRNPGKGKTETLRADNYEYPFDVILEGSLPESIEGLHDTWITYRFKAEIGRKFSKDIVFRKPLRIIRTLDPGNLELSHAMSIANTWTDKIEYSISTPTKAVVFGTSVTVEFCIVPLLKGLRIGTVKTNLMEIHEFKLEPENGISFTTSYKSQRKITADEHVVDKGEDPEILNEEAEGFEFSRHIELPKTLKKCVQDTEVKGIKIRHKLEFTVQLHNPDGHISELRASLPVQFFISPNTAINENNDLVDQRPVAGREAANTDLFAAPPLYGQHQFDQLYSDVDPSGYRTPEATVSSSNTPFGPYSRNLSAENLSNMVSMDSLAVDDNISPSTLATRLSDLGGRHSPPDLRRNTETIRDANASQRSSSTFRRPSHPDSSGSNSASHSRRSSAENSSGPESGTIKPHSAEFEDISRIPSYTTAVNTRVRTPHSNDLPSYGDAVSRNNSATGLAELNTPQPPNPAHLRPGVGSRSGGNLVSLAWEAIQELPRSHSQGDIPRLHPGEDARNRSNHSRPGL